VQVDGLSDGAILDPLTGAPLVDNPGFQAAIEQFARLFDEDATEMFIPQNGRCAVFLGHTAKVLYFNEAYPMLPFPLPGVTTFLNRVTNKMEMCTQVSCPYSDADGVMSVEDGPVNYSPYITDIFTVIINANIGETRINAALKLVDWLLDSKSERCDEDGRNCSSNSMKVLAEVACFDPWTFAQFESPNSDLFENPSIFRNAPSAEASDESRRIFDIYLKMKKWGTTLALNSDNLNFPLRFEGSSQFIVRYEAEFEAFAKATVTLPEVRAGIKEEHVRWRQTIDKKHPTEPLFFVNGYRNTINLASFTPDDVDEGVSTALIAIFSVLLAVIVIAGVILYKRKRATMFAEQNKRLAEIAAAKRNFLASMSHELRTPINGILGMAQLIEFSSSASAETQELCENIHIASRSLMAIVSKVLDFNRIENNVAGGEKSDTSIENVVMSAIDSATQPVSNHSSGTSNVAYIIDEDVPRVAWYDGTPFVRVLLQLIDNSIKFSHGSGDILVHVSTSNAGEMNKSRATMRSMSDAYLEDPKGDMFGNLFGCCKARSHYQLTSEQCMLVVKVYDRGMGIDKSKQAKLFGRFSQGDMSDTRAFGGIGLGLALSVNLVDKLLGGHVWIDRSVSQRDMTMSPKDAGFTGTGTTIAFCAVVDCLSADELEASAPFFVERQLYGRDNPRSIFYQLPRPLRRRALLVEESEFVARALSTFLLSLSFTHVTHVTSGEEALQTVRGSDRFDFVFIDASLALSGHFTATDDRGSYDYNSNDKAMASLAEKSLKRLADTDGSKDAPSAKYLQRSTGSSSGSGGDSTRNKNGSGGGSGGGGGGNGGSDSTHGSMGEPAALVKLHRQMNAAELNVAFQTEYASETDTAAANAKGGDDAATGDADEAESQPLLVVMKNKNITKLSVAIVNNLLGRTAFNSSASASELEDDEDVKSEISAIQKSAASCKWAASMRKPVMRFGVLKALNDAARYAGYGNQMRRKSISMEEANPADRHNTARMVSQGGTLDPGTPLSPTKKITQAENYAGGAAGNDTSPKHKPRMGVRVLESMQNDRDTGGNMETIQQRMDAAREDADVLEPDTGLNMRPGAGASPSAGKGLGGGRDTVGSAITLITFVMIVCVICTLRMSPSHRLYATLHTTSTIPIIIIIISRSSICNFTHTTNSRRGP
jgi:signal transduction histidine kinase/CheY-like chemotaxis protein